MPKPTILPIVQWDSVFESGLDFDAWIEQGENEKYREKLKEFLAEQELDQVTMRLLRAVDRPVHVLAIAEDWCPDVIRHVPPLMKMAECCEFIKVRFITREQHPEAFIRFLTNGGEAVPKFIFFSDKFVECGSWGPMASDCREIIAKGKALGDVGAARKIVFQMIKDDPGCATAVKEVAHLVDIDVCNGHNGIEIRARKPSR